MREPVIVAAMMCAVGVTPCIAEGPAPERPLLGSCAFDDETIAAECRERIRARVSDWARLDGYLGCAERTCIRVQRGTLEVAGGPVIRTEILAEIVVCGPDGRSHDGPRFGFDVATCELTSATLHYGAPPCAPLHCATLLSITAEDLEPFSGRSEALVVLVDPRGTASLLPAALPAWRFAARFASTLRFEVPPDLVDGAVPVELQLVRGVSGPFTVRERCGPETRWWTRSDGAWTAGEWTKAR